MMKVSEYRKKKKSFPIFPLVIGLFIISLMIVLILKKQGISLIQKAKLKVESIQGDALVTLDDQELSNTPLITSTTKIGNHTLSLIKSHPFYALFSQNIDLTVGQETFVRRELGPTSYFSSGTTTYFKKEGSGLSLVSSPEAVQVLVSGEEKGETPLFLPELAPGNYEVTLLKEGFEQKKLSLEIKSGYTTFASVDLFQIPLPLDSSELKNIPLSDFPSVETMSRESWKADETLKTNGEEEYFPVSSLILIDLSTTDLRLLSDIDGWIRGIYFYDLQYLGLSDINWHFFIDREGKIYEGKKGGSEVVLPEEEKGKVKVGYLGKVGEGLTQKAESSFNLLEKSTSNEKKSQATIKEGGNQSSDLEAGKKKNIAVIYQNIGDTIWYDQSPKQVFLGTENSTSLFYTSDNWVSTNKVKILPVAYVGKDQQVRFEFEITGPNQDGEQREKFALYLEKNGNISKIDGSDFEIVVKITGGVQSMVLIKETGTGYLNVRDQAGIGGGVIDRVTPGEKYPYTEEQEGWIKIKLSTGVEGWVSSQYVEKL